MGEKYTIGLDYGTLSGRGVLVRCSDGKVVVHAAKEYAHGVMDRYLPDGETALPEKWYLQHPADYLEVLEYVVKELLTNSNVEKQDIIGIGIDFTASTVMPIDEAGTPLCMKSKYCDRRNAYVKLWKHHGAQKEADDINAVLERLGQANTPRFGGAISPELLVPKALEMLHEDPEIFEAAAEIIEAGDWLTRMLTGSRSRSCSMAGYKAWWNAEEGYPMPEFFTALDSRLTDFISQKLPGPVCPIGGTAGHLLPKWAERLGLSSGIPVAPAVIDSHAGVPGSGVSKKEQAMLVLGTSSVLVALCNQPYSQKGVCGGVRDAIIPGYYALESGLAAVGDLFSWFTTTLLPAGYEQEAKELGVDIYTLLNRRAGNLAVGESGLLILDWWNGNKTPFVDGNLTGSITGLTLNTRPEEIYRALIEATAFGTRQIFDLFKESGVQVKELIASGGIASKNPLLMQIYADVLGVDIKISASDQAAALGCAIYAALTAGAQKGGYDSYQEAVERMSQVKVQGYRFDLGNHMAYERLYALYQTYSGVMGESERMLSEELCAMKMKAVLKEK